MSFSHRRFSDLSQISHTFVSSSKATDAVSWILFGSSLVMSNPGFGSPLIRNVVILIGCLMILVGTTKSQVSISSTWLPILRVAMVVLLAEALIILNQPNSLDLIQLSFRGICYIFIVGGIACGISLRRFQSIDIRLCTAILPLLTSFSSLRYILGDGGLALNLVGRNVISDQFSPVGICFNYGILATLMFVIVVADRRLFCRLTAAFAFIMAVIVMLSSGSRGGILSLLLSIGCHGFGLLIGGTLRIKFFVIAIFVTIFICAPILFNSLGLGDQLSYVTARFQGISSDEVDTSILERQFIRNFYFENFDHWWLTGYQGYKGVYPHNIFLELWVRFGIFGLILSLGLINIIWRLVRLIFVFQTNELIILLALPTLFNIINAQTSLALEFNRWLLLGVGFVLSFPPSYALRSVSCSATVQGSRPSELSRNVSPL